MRIREATTRLIRAGRTGRQETEAEEVLKVLAVVSEGGCRETLTSASEKAGWSLRIAETAEAAMVLLNQETFGVVLYQRGPAETSWGAKVSCFAKTRPRPWIVLLSDNADANLWDELARNGGSDILRTPLRREAVLETVDSGWSLWRSQQKLRRAAEVHGEG